MTWQFDEESKRHVEKTYREIQKQWVERAQGANVSDIYLMFPKNYERILEIEKNLDNAKNYEEVFSLCERMFNIYMRIFKDCEKKLPPIPHEDKKGGLYIFKDKKHLQLNEWLPADGIDLESLTEYLGDRCSLLDLLLKIKEEDRPKPWLYNVYLANDGSYEESSFKALDVSKIKEKGTPVKKAQEDKKPSEDKLQVLDLEDLFGSEEEEKVLGSTSESVEEDGFELI